MRRWQQRLADLFSAQGHEVSWIRGEPRRLGSVSRTALALEQRLFGPCPSLFDTISIDEVRGASCGADLTIVLDGAFVNASFVIEPLFDGAAGDAALIAMLTTGRSPYVEVRTRMQVETIDVMTAILAVPDRDVLSRALDQVLARIVTLIVKSVRWYADRECGAKSASPPSRAPSNVSPLAFMARGWCRKLIGRLSGMSGAPSHWRVGYRHIDGVPSAVGERTWSEQPFEILADDGTRFYADPVPFEHEGRHFLFVEDYPYATGKGVIAVTEIAADGTPSAVRQVLERPWHLSYPFLVRHGSETYMLPEMSAARRVQLFRAEKFPDRWVADRVLLDDIVAADATLIEHAGRWWMFATLADDGGSSWDQLCLFHAPDLFGPWTPHAANPVLVDAGAARPAGAMWRAEDGSLMRVAQDCRTGYGVGLTICRVDRLDERAFAQTVVARVAPPDGYGADGTHTLGRTGNFEVIDLRFPPASRGRSR